MQSWLQEYARTRVSVNQLRRCPFPFTRLIDYQQAAAQRWQHPLSNEFEKWIHCLESRGKIACLLFMPKAWLLKHWSFLPPSSLAYGPIVSTSLGPNNFYATMYKWAWYIAQFITMSILPAAVRSDDYRILRHGNNQTIFPIKVASRRWDLLSCFSSPLTFRLPVQSSETFWSQCFSLPLTSFYSRAHQWSSLLSCFTLLVTYNQQGESPTPLHATPGSMLTHRCRSCSDRRWPRTLLFGQLLCLAPRLNN